MSEWPQSSLCGEGHVRDLGKFFQSLPSLRAPNNHLLLPSITFLLPEPGAGVMGAGQTQVPVAEAPLECGVKAAVLSPEEGPQDTVTPRVCPLPLACPKHQPSSGANW